MSAPNSKELVQLLNPKSIAVIGASNNVKKLGYITIRNILDSGFEGKIFPVNPKGEEILDHKCFINYASIPEIPDLAVVAVPANIVLEVLKDIAQKGTKNVVVFTAGFKETGKEGGDLENEIIELLKKNKINMLGPNCLGFVNNELPVNVTFGQVVKNVGPLRFISQSGAIAASIFDWFEHTGMGFTHFVTLGNKAVLNENDFLKYWLDECPEEYAPIGMYLESIEDGRLFLNLAKKLSTNHPLFLLKPGKSNAAKTAMQSHTGSLAGENSVLEAALKEAGIIKCQGMQDMFDLSRAFSWGKLPKGPNVAIISNAGGPAVISADLVADSLLKLVPVDASTKEILEKHLPRAASILNPIDVLGDALADRYNIAIEAVLKEEAIHSLIVLLTPQVMTQIEETAEVIWKLSEKYNKPIYCSFIGGSLVAKGEVVLNKHKIPSFSFPERAVKALSSVWEWANWVQETKVSKESLNSLITDKTSTRDRSVVTKVVDTALNEDRTILSGLEVDKILSSAGIDTPPSKHVSTIKEAQEFSKEHSWPVVLKISSSKVLHKKEEGGVILNINTEEKLRQAYKTLSNTQFGDSIQIQKQIESGVEVIVGSKTDISFGKVLMFGAGGTFAELVVDRNLHLAPLEFNEIVTLVNNSKVGKILNGYRGDTPYKLDKLYELIFKVSELVTEISEFKELEINPVIVTKDNVWAVDGKVILWKKNTE